MAESYRFGYWGATSEEILKSHFPVHRACRDGDMEALALLLVEHQQAVYTEDSFYGWTPAHWAAYFGKLACIRKLIQNTSLAVDTNCDLKTSRFLQTPAHLSAFGGHPQCLLWLLQSGSSAEAQDYLGESTVHKAARTGSIECISLLASHGANLSKCNNNRLTPAQLAANCGYAECARYIEAAAIRQDMQQPEDRESSSLPLSVTEPSPHDITAVPKGAPCVINAGINGGQLPPPANHIPEEMEGCESQEGGACCAPLSNGLSNGHSDAAISRDITLHRGISCNMVPVAGRKRSREDDEEMDFKRIRTSDDTIESYTNGHSNGLHGSSIYSAELVYDRMACGDEVNHNSFESMSECCRPLSADGYVSEMGDGKVHSFGHLTIEVDNTSNTAVEHHRSILLEQGYDSLLCGALEI